MWTPGIGELIVIFVIVLVLFGGKKLPGLAKGLGQGIFEFKKGISGQLDADDLDLEKPPRKKVAAKQMHEDDDEEEEAPAPKKTRSRKKA